MNPTCERWADEEFATLELGDARRVARTKRLAASVAETPGGRITSVVASSADAEGAFRWVRNPRVSPAALLAAGTVATVRRCDGLPFVFVAVDQTSLKVVDHERAKGFGHVGRGGGARAARGLQVMTALAVNPNGTSMGLLGQSWWARADEPAPWGKKDRRPIEERESSLWLSCMEQGVEAFNTHGDGCRPWFQVDRGGDTFHVLTLAHEHQAWVTVRSAYDRRLVADKPRYLWQSLAGKKRAGFVELTLINKQCKRLERSPRQATIKLGISYTSVTLQLSSPVDQRQRKQPVNVVRVREYRPPKGAKRLEWWLVTTHPVRSFEEAKLVVKGYTLRWRIEEFHHTWKTGACDVGASQLRSPDNFKRWATLLAMVAARIERLKYAARNDPDAPALRYFSRNEVDAAILVSKTRKFKRGDDLTVHQVVHLVAIIGGYTGNTKAGPPGTKTIRRGLERVELIALGMGLSEM